MPDIFATALSWLRRRRTGGHIELGDAVAAAQRAEQAHTPPGPSPLAGHDYRSGQPELWRWRPHPTDAVVAAFVHAYANAEATERQQLRDRLTMEDLYGVLFFARRRALEAIRTGDQSLVTEAFDALSTIDLDRIDDRDLAVAAMIGVAAASRAGLPATAAAAGTMARAVPDVAEILEEIVAEEIDLLDDAGYRLVDTADGPVLLDDFLDPYEPRADLTGIALSLAGELDNVQGVTAGTGLAPVWVGDNPAQSGITGCVSVDTTSGGIEVVIYLAEAASSDDAAALAAGASQVEIGDHTVTASAAGHLTAVLVASGTGEAADRALTDLRPRTVTAIQTDS